MSSVEFFNQFETAIANLLAARTGILVAQGQRMYLALAIIATIWFGVEMAQKHEWNPLAWMKFMMVLCIGQGMIGYYNRPLPGLGETFPQIVTNEAKGLAQLIGMNAVDNLNGALASMMARFETPSIAHIGACIIYGAIVLLVGFCAALAFIVILLGFVATAVELLIGPIMIPFYLFPGLERWFWNWLNSFVQYAFFRVFAAAVVYIVSNAMVAFVNSLPSSIPVGDMMVMQIEIFMALGASIFAILYIPAMCSSNFSGTSFSPTVRVW